MRCFFFRGFFFSFLPFLFFFIPSGQVLKVPILLNTQTGGFGICSPVRFVCCREPGPRSLQLTICISIYRLCLIYGSQWHIAWLVSDH